MNRRRTKNKLENWEVSIIKAMLETGTFGNDQDILAYFTRPDRSINHSRILEIRRGERHVRTKPATVEELEQFIKSWPQIDPATGLHILNDELLIKAREAMLFAVQSYNNPRALFRSEIFIVTAVIAWTYMLHAYYRKANVDYRYKSKKRDGDVSIQKTKQGEDKYWDLSKCLKSPHCPVKDTGTVHNLSFLIEIRHEIEHRMTTRIDAALSAKLQACCLNFNRTMKELFGERFGLDDELSFALQFSGLSVDQKRDIFASADLPAHIEAARAKIEDKLTEDQYNDPNYAYRVLFVPKTVNKRAQSDRIVEFVPAGSKRAEMLNSVYLKEVDKARYKPSLVVKKMQDEGYLGFGITQHTDLWKAMGAKNPAKGYGVETESDGWRWYDHWVDVVRGHCKENRERYI